MPVSTKTPIDDLTGGLKPGTLTIIHGLSGAGKTTLLLYMASRMAEEGLDVIFMDAEGNAPPNPPYTVVTVPHSMEAQTKLISMLSRSLEDSEAPVVILDSITYNYSLEVASLLASFSSWMRNLGEFKDVYVRPLLYQLEVQLRMLREIAYRCGGFSITSAVFKPTTASGFRCDYEFRLIHSPWSGVERIIVAEEPPELRLRAIRYVMELCSGGVAFRSLGGEVVDEEVLRRSDVDVLMDDWLGVIVG